MPNKIRPELLPKVVERLRAIADESRMRLLMRLREGQANVTTLADELGVAQASVSKHLAVLREVGLVASTRRANQVIYGIKDESVFEMCEIVCRGVVRHLHDEQKSLAEVLRPSDLRWATSNPRTKPTTKRRKT